MLVGNGCEGLAGRPLEGRVVDDVKIAGRARALGAQSRDQRMDRHHVVVDDQVEAGKLSLQRLPVDRVILGDEVLAEEVARPSPGRNARPPRSECSRSWNRTRRSRPSGTCRARRDGFRNPPPSIPARPHRRPSRPRRTRRSARAAPAVRLPSLCAERQDRRSAEFLPQRLVQIAIGHEPRRTPGPAPARRLAQRARGNRVDAIDHHLLGRDERAARPASWEGEAHLQDGRCRPDLLAADRGEPVQRIVLDHVLNEPGRKEDEIGGADLLCARPRNYRFDLALRRIVAELDEDDVAWSRSGARDGKHVRQHARTPQKVERRAAAGDQERREMDIVGLADAAPERRDDVVEAKHRRWLGGIGEERDRGIFRPRERGSAGTPHARNRPASGAGTAPCGACAGS